jgi:hypothetical protein
MVGTKAKTWGINSSSLRYPLNDDSREGLHTRLGNRLLAHNHDETAMGPATWVFDSWVLSYRALILPPAAIWIALLFWRFRRCKRFVLP